MKIQLPEQISQYAVSYITVFITAQYSVAGILLEEINTFPRLESLYGIWQLSVV